MIELKGISKSFTTGSFTQVALDDINLSFRNSEFVAILGPSGSGKTTLLNIMGGLDKATSGDLIINGVSTKNYKDANWDTYRNHHVGFVFQSYNLIPHQTVLANVELALTLSGVSASERKQRAIDALSEVGLAEHINKKPNQLSGGQAQRVAIARALVNNPDIILADEPTGALDTATGISIMDTLDKVSKDRLVIMVTHNPELAQDYATRIVSLQDGHILSDSNPFVADSTDIPETNKKTNKASMSFITALSLSFNNLMTKKGRTFLTAFAGSIGIIGIATILALSNGVNNFIVKSEQDSMSSLPLVISREEFDMSDFKGMEDPFGFGGNEEEVEETTNPDAVPQKKTIKEMYGQPEEGKSNESEGNHEGPTLKKNNLAAFKKYIDDNGGGIKDHANSIVYDYNIQPIFMSKNSKDAPTILQSDIDTNSVSSMMQGAMSMSPFASKQNSGFSPMFDNDAIVKDQYELVEGTWPKDKHDALLVLDNDGSISDFTLYRLGILDQTKVKEYVASINSKDKKKKELPQVELTYKDALNLKYRVATQADIYKKVKGGWEDASKDKSILNSAYNNGIEIQVVGVIKPKSEANAVSLSEGINYSRELNEEMIDKAANSQIVKQQLENPKVDVFSGKTFKSIEDGNANNLDNLVNVDANALDDAINFDMGDISEGSFSLDPSMLQGLDPSMYEIDPSELNFDAKKLFEAINPDTIKDIMDNAPAPDLEGISVKEELTESEQAQLTEEIVKLSRGVMPWYLAHKTEFSKDASYLDIAKAYLNDDATKQSIAAIETIFSLNEAQSQELEQRLTKYFEEDLVPYVTKSTQTLTKSLSEALATQIADTINTHMTTVSEGMAEVLSQAMSEAVSNYAMASMGAASIPGGLSDAISMDNTDSLEDMFKNFYKPHGQSLEDNLSALGYADTSDPHSISIYPKSFNDKAGIKEAIDAYNTSVEQDYPERVITYSDMFDNIISSITEMVNMVSMVLIAFVSISLVVSSIMIGIITYISVLERKKEIGILRAMGASKRNIANVFNAETVIEGAISGIFAILVVLLVSIPVNSWMMTEHKVPNIMSLPATSALILIAISIGLTLIAGLIPSQKAARRDPVEALRSE